MKRSDYISWDEYFMGIAMLAAKRSKDPNTQVGACIVSQDNIIISTGYNGMPKGCSDDEYPWEREISEGLHALCHRRTLRHVRRSIGMGTDKPGSIRSRR